MEVTLTDISRRVARVYGVSDNIAWGFTLGVMEEVVRSLDAGNAVKLRGIGTLAWKFTPGLPGVANYTVPIPDGWKLRFIPSRKFRSRRTKMSDEEGMSKYGVELDHEKTKQAGVVGKNNCPVCNLHLDDAGACPTHGTEPLEPTNPRAGRHIP
jgi:hypothetical protein